MYFGLVEKTITTITCIISVYQKHLIHLTKYSSHNIQVTLNYLDIYFDLVKRIETL